MDCIPLNNGIDPYKGTPKVVAKNSDHYTVVQSSSGIEGIFKSSNRGEQWMEINYNLTQYDLIKFSNITINDSGTVLLSIRDNGVSKLDESVDQWILLK